MNKAEQIIKERFSVVVFITSQDEIGKDKYYYVAVAGTELEKFKQELDAGTLNPNDYKILRKGYGAPDASTREEMAKEYGCQPDNAVPLKNNN